MHAAESASSLAKFMTQNETEVYDLRFAGHGLVPRPALL